VRLADLRFHHPAQIGQTGPAKDGKHVKAEEGEADPETIERQAQG
jgi:hypothetical protein